MLIDFGILFGYVICARWVILRINNPLLRSIAGPFMGGVMGAFMKIGIVEDSFLSFTIILTACLYLIFLSGSELKKKSFFENK
jgi:hypothetical protein